MEKKCSIILTRTLLCALFFTPLLSFAACVGGACNATSTQNTTFTQNLYVNGTVTKGSGSFVIDHPLDPKNKLLYHSFVESPDMKNLYDGIVTLDRRGEAVVQLPRYFLALNRDFRYLATALGDPSPNLYVKEEARKAFFGLMPPRFLLAGGRPGGRVSWQVTGIRNDRFAQTYPIIVEVNKDDSGIVPAGEYLLPEYYTR